MNRIISLVIALFVTLALSSMAWAQPKPNPFAPPIPGGGGPKATATATAAAPPASTGTPGKGPGGGTGQVRMCEKTGQVIPVSAWTKEKCEPNGEGGGGEAPPPATTTPSGGGSGGSLPIYGGILLALVLAGYAVYLTRKTRQELSGVVLKLRERVENAENAVKPPDNDDS